LIVTFTVPGKEEKKKNIITESEMEIIAFLDM